MIVYPSPASIPDGLWRWPNFSPKEMACRCNGRYCDGRINFDPAFMDALEALRAAVGRPLRINSATRCPLHNAAVGGAARSQHKIGCAVDISVAGWSWPMRALLVRGALRLGFGGIGYASNFLHLDWRKRNPPAQWDYTKGGMALWKSHL